MSSTRGVAVLGVPTSAGAHAPGQEKAPAAFRAAGLIDLLRAAAGDVRDLGDLPVVRWTPDRANPRAQHAGLVAKVSERVASRVAAEVASAKARSQPDLILVLGGDCTIEVGVVAGFLPAGERIGLVYLDAGADLNTPAAVRLGFLDWMGMAHLLGVPGATPELSKLGSRFPLLQPDQVVLAGTVIEELTEFEQAQIERLPLSSVTSETVANDPLGAAMQAIAALGDIDRILLHIDVDVIDFLDFPAADFPTINAGLTLVQALGFIAGVASDPRLAAVTVCEFNPDHVDEEHELVRTFVAQLTEALM